MRNAWGGGWADYPLPEDFGAFPERSAWHRGPLGEPGAPRYRLSAPVAAGARRLRLEPEPTAASDIGFGYLANRWVGSADGGVFRTAIVEDTDRPLFDGNLMEMDLVWRFKQTRGLAFAAELAEFEIERDRRFAADAGSRDVQIARTRRNPLLTAVPESGFGGVSGIGDGAAR